MGLLRLIGLPIYKIIPNGFRNSIGAYVYDYWEKNGLNKDLKYTDEKAPLKR